MAISICFNPLDTACKSIIGGIKQGETLQLNLFLLKKLEDKRFYTPNYNFKTPKLEECLAPIQNAFLRGWVLRCKIDIPHNCLVVNVPSGKSHACCSQNHQQKHDYDVFSF